MDSNLINAINNIAIIYPSGSQFTSDTSREYTSDSVTKSGDKMLGTKNSTVKYTPLSAMTGVKHGFLSTSGNNFEAPGLHEYLIEEPSQLNTFISEFTPENQERLTIKKWSASDAGLHLQIGFLKPNLTEAQKQASEFAKNSFLEQFEALFTPATATA